MSTHVLLVDLVAILFAVVGFHLAFRQAVVRRWLDARRAKQGKAPLLRGAAGEDPLHYALLIFGTMTMAFGIIIFGFTTMYALVT